MFGNNLLLLEQALRGLLLYFNAGHVTLRTRLVSTEILELLQMPRDRKKIKDTKGGLTVTSIVQVPRSVDITLGSVDNQG